MNDYKLLAGFYGPIFRKQLIWYPVCSVVATALFLLMLFIAGEDSTAEDVTTYAFPISALTYMWIFAPIVLNRIKSPEVTVLMPVAPRSQAIFLIVYFMLAIPALLFIPTGIICTIAEFTMPSVSEGLKIYSEIEHMSTLPLLVCSIGSNFMMVAIALFTMVRARQNALLKAFLAIIGAIIVIGLISGFFGFYFAISNMDEFARSMPDKSQAVSASQFLAIFTGPKRYVFTTIGSLVTVGTILFVTMAYRQILKRQI